MSPTTTTGGMRDDRIDPCAGAMAAYLKCVEGKTAGLRDGDECAEEGSEYKACRQRVKAAKRGNSTSNTTSTAVLAKGEKSLR